MKKYLLHIGGLILASTMTGDVFAQTTQTTTTTTVRETRQNPDGTYTVIEYPVGKEVMVNLTPTTMIPGAKGTAKIIRSADGTAIALDLTGVTGDMKSYNVYTVDSTGAISSVGTVNIENGTGRANLTTPLNQFMLVLSPESNLTAYDTNTSVVLRSAVPQGQAIVPVSRTAGTNKSVATTVTTPAYNAPLLGVARRSGDSEIRVKFTGELEGMKGKAYINPRSDGVTQIKMRFDEMDKVPKGDRRLVLWAVSPDNKYVKLGQVINSGQREEAEIRSETKLRDFGLFVTMEMADVDQPSGVIVTEFSE